MVIVSAPGLEYRAAVANGFGSLCVMTRYGDRDDRSSVFLNLLFTMMLKADAGHRVMIVKKGQRCSSSQAAAVVRKCLLPVVRRRRLKDRPFLRSPDRGAGFLFR